MACFSARYSSVKNRLISYGKECFNDPIKQIGEGFFSGLAAGFIGYVTDVVIGTMFEAFQPINPLFAVLGAFYAIVSFLLGIEEEYYAGIFFSFGIITAGFLLSDFLTTVSGCISLVGIVLSLVVKTRK
jgi:hypothetical protein